jgi:hypothetical protein
MEAEPDYELVRILKVAKEGLEKEREAGDDPYVDSFAIVVIYNWEDDNGETHEAASVWSESARHFHKQGILWSGLKRLDEHESAD